MSALLRRIFCLFLSLLFITGCICICSIICVHPSEEVENTVDSFYREEKGSLDVVMIGSSAASKDFQPKTIETTCGIKSYCMGIGACSANIYSSVLQEVITTQPEALFLIDLDGFVVDDKFQKETPPIALWVDSMPNNENKTELIKRYFSNEKAEYYFPFIRYHRYMTSLPAYIPITYRLLKKEMLNIKDPLGGATLNDKKSIKSEIFINSYKESVPLDNFSNKIFKEFLDYVKENNLKNVIFINFPKVNTDDFTIERNIKYAKRTNYIRSEAEKIGYMVLDYNAMGNPANLDPNNDFADTLHLTSDGAKKFSAYLAYYFLENHKLLHFNY